MANKWLVGGLILAGGVAGWYYINKQQPSSSPASSPGGSAPSTSSSGTSTPAPANTGGTSQDQQMRQQLLQWATGTQNVPLYQAWINQLSSTELSQMYDILVNDWNKTGQPTQQQAANWGALVSKYPFLRYAGVKDGVKCTNFTCN